MMQRLHHRVFEDWFYVERSYFHPVFSLTNIKHSPFKTLKSQLTKTHRLQILGDDHVTTCIEHKLHVVGVCCLRVMTVDFALI